MMDGLVDGWPCRDLVDGFSCLVLEDDDALVWIFGGHKKRKPRRLLGLREAKKEKSGQREEMSEESSFQIHGKI